MSDKDSYALLQDMQGMIGEYDFKVIGLAYDARTPEYIDIMLEGIDGKYHLTFRKEENKNV